MTNSNPKDAEARPWHELLARIGLQRVSVEATARRPVSLTGPICSMVRGLIGERLRELRCLTGAPTCTGCAEHAGCDYALLFEGAGDETVPPTYTDPRGLVRPFWLKGVPASRRLTAGTSFVAQAIVAGEAQRMLAYLDVALRDALARIGATPGAVALGPSRTGALDLAIVGHHPSSLRVRTLTPLLLRGDRAACEQASPQAPWLALLVRAGVRRLWGLCTALAGATPAELAPPAALTDVSVSGGLKRWRGSRFSHRQKSRLPLEGWVGEAILSGDGVPAIAPLLLALAQTSVGRLTALGFGDLSVEQAEPIRTG